MVFFSPKNVVLFPKSVFVPGEGYITTQTLREILKELDNKLGEEDLDGIIEEIDEDGSGTVDFDGKINILMVK